MSEGLNSGGSGGPQDGENPENWLSLDYVHEQVLAQLQAQSDLWDAVDGRLRLILGFIGIVFAAAIGLQRAVPGATGPSGPVLLPFWVGTAAAAAVLVYLTPDSSSHLPIGQRPLTAHQSPTRCGTNTC